MEGFLFTFFVDLILIVTTYEFDYKFVVGLRYRTVQQQEAGSRQAQQQLR